MPDFLKATIEVLIGIGLLFGGGELFVQGSIALAVIFGIPQLVIGLTVVAFGTSAPELFVSLSSIGQGADALAVTDRGHPESGLLGLAAPDTGPAHRSSAAAAGHAKPEPGSSGTGIASPWGDGSCSPE